MATNGIEESGAGGSGRPLATGAVLIAGPTASGKSALALEIARVTGGVIVNADSMQVYGGLAVLTARPDAQDLAAAPHRLYGHVAPERPYSTGAWLEDVAGLLPALGGHPPIFVGGTGLYFEALEGGMSAMPQVPETIREACRARLAAEGPGPLHAELAVLDPATAARLAKSDGQRILRALEVFHATGRPISYWQSRPGAPLIDPATAVRLLVEPDREELRRRIDRRFDRMMEDGALAEAETFLARGLDPVLPAMKAIGVPELGAHLRGEMSLADAVAMAKARSRQYAKRQGTWFRNRFGPRWRRLPPGAAVEKIDLPSST